MAGVGLGGFFNGDPNPNPFTDILPATGGLVGDNGQIIVDPDYRDLSTYEDHDGYDPPTGNGLAAPIYETQRQENQVSKRVQYAEAYGASKLTVLKDIEEEIRDLLLTRKKLLRELKAERDEIDKRLNVSESVTTALDEMFPEQLAHEIESGVINE
jgi:hypothetical protein